MPSIREIRRRIQNFKSTQKITKAMEMVASVKMRKGRTQILSARPYALKLAEIAGHLRASIVANASPLLRPRTGNRIHLVVVTSDKGMCGSFNANILKRANLFLKEHAAQDITVTLIGKKGADYYRRRKVTSEDSYVDFFFKPTYAPVADAAKKVLDGFLTEKYDEVWLIYNEFKSAAVQRTCCDKMLPVQPFSTDEKDLHTDYLFEPAADDVLEALLGKYFVYQLWRVVLESYAAEQSARMTAMNGATKNAGELIDKLTLTYNKVRQSTITRELIEVISGAESLK